MPMGKLMDHLDYTEIERPIHTPVGDAIAWLRSWAAEVEKETGTQNEFLSLSVS